MFVIPAVGNVIFCVIISWAVAVHPLAPVAVTVYVPGIVIVVFDTASPLLHKYVSPPVAVNEILVKLHVSSVAPVLFVIPAVGATIFCVIISWAVAVHPFAPVAVTVYVPGIVIVVFDTASPLLHE